LTCPVLAVNGSFHLDTQEPVTACPALLAANGQPSSTPVPPTVQYPHIVPRPPGIQVFGVGLPDDFGNLSREVDNIIAPPGFTCAQPGMGGDGGVAVSIYDRANPQHAINEVISAGGVGTDLELTCPYISQVNSLDQQIEGQVYEQSICTPLVGTKFTQLEINNPNLYAAVVWFPPTIQRPDYEVAPLVTPTGDGVDSTVALFTAQITNGTSVDTEEIDCTLPSSQLCRNPLVLSGGPVPCWQTVEPVQSGYRDVRAIRLLGPYADIRHGPTKVLRGGKPCARKRYTCTFAPTGHAAGDTAVAAKLGRHSRSDRQPQ
jgi:hypothetical protein